MIEQQPVESTATLRQQAYDFVKAKIMNLELKPGQNMTDSEVASGLGIGRTPVREGLRRLEHEGLLINQARRGWRVYVLSLEDIHDIFDIKEAVEGMLARHAAECSDEQLQNALVQAMEQIDAPHRRSRRRGRLARGRCLTPSYDLCDEWQRTRG